MLSTVQAVLFVVVFSSLAYIRVRCPIAVLTLLSGVNDV
jgi:hypothetical protein